MLVYRCKFTNIENDKVEYEELTEEQYKQAKGMINQGKTPYIIEVLKKRDL